MTAIAAVSNGESGSSVRTKLNSAITLVNANNLADLREAMVDADKTFTAGFREVYLSVALTGAKTLTLPAASAFPAGTELIFADEIGGITSTNTVAVTRAGADTINGSATAFTLYTPNVVFKLVTDGSSKWTGGVVSSNTDGTYTAWVPAFTGFSADPTSVTARYRLVGKTCFFYINSTAGTSNTTTFTLTLPIAAANTVIQTMNGRGTDNGAATTQGTVRTRVNSTTADVYPTGGLTNWTAAGAKNWVGIGFYETI